MRNTSNNTIQFDNIMLGIAAPNQKNFYKDIASKISKKFNVGEQTLLLKLVSQDKKENVAIGNGVAISHVQFSELDEPKIILCRPKKAIDMDAPDGLPIDLFCVVMSSKNKMGESLQMVSALSRIMSDAFLCDQMRCMQSTDEIYNMMSERQIIRRRAA